MSVAASICSLVLWAKCCSVDIADEYVLQATYGDPAAEETLAKLQTLDCYIDTVENFKIATENDFVEDGVMYLNGKQIVLSDKNSLYLESAGKKIQLTSDDINCISEDDLCKIINKIKDICPDC